MEPLLKWLSILVFSVTVLFAAESVTDRGLWNLVLSGLLVWIVTGSTLLTGLAYSSWRITMLAEHEEQSKPTILKPHAGLRSRQQSSASIPMTTFQKSA